MNIGRFMPKVRRDYAAAVEYLRARGSRREDGIAEMQLRKLREVWRDAIMDVPYYESLVREGRAPAEIATWDDFRAIPELTREVLQDHAAEFVRRSGPPDLWRMTGGSTGNPVKFGVWHIEDEVIRMLKLVLWARTGYSPRDRIFLIWGHSHLLGTGWRRHWNHFLRKTKDALLGYRRVDAYALNPEACRRYAGQLLAFKPAGLVGYSAALDYFVRALPDLHGKFRRLGLKFVMPCAEPAPREDSFHLLEDIFGCPVIQEFGGVDFGQVAMKFGDEPFEVFPEYNILEGVGSMEQELDGEVRMANGEVEGARVEISETGEVGGAGDLGTWGLKDQGTKGPRDRGQETGGGGQGTEGLKGERTKGPRDQGSGPEEAAVVTALYRRYLPLIRYRQGDVLGECEKLPHGHVMSFGRLVGRVNDMVELSDGTSVHSVAIFHCIHQEPGVLNIQMVLEDAGPKILLATGTGYDKQTEERIRGRLRQISAVLGNASIEETQDVEVSRAGKRRWFVDRRSR